MTSRHLQCYELAVKSYLPEWDQIYLRESEAFKGVKYLDGVVKYLGAYSLVGSDAKKPTHHIMLEFGEQDLEEYFATTSAPVLNSEIIAFWEGIFKISETLQKMHQLEHKQQNGEVKTFRGSVRQSYFPYSGGTELC